MREIDAFEAMSRLGTLLDRVEHEEEVLNTPRDVEVARLVSAEPGVARANARHAADGIIECRPGLRLDGLRIKALVDEGRL